MMRRFNIIFRKKCPKYDILKEKNIQRCLDEKSTVDGFLERDPKK